MVVADVDPVVIDTLKTVGIGNILRIVEVERNERNGEIPLGGLKPQRKTL